MPFPLRYLLACFMLAAASVAAGGDVRVTDAWSRATPPGAHVGAAYFVLTNLGESDRLVRADSPIAERTELHMTRQEGGMMRMQPVHSVELEQGKSVAFAPGGRHLMLIGLTRPLREGDTFPLTLTFEKAGDIEVTVHVRSATGLPKAGH